MLWLLDDSGQAPGLQEPRFEDGGSVLHPRMTSDSTSDFLALKSLFLLPAPSGPPPADDQLPEFQRGGPS